ncbi:MAG TPA: hypothetical protein P5081_15835 [Phycisphaerae bacterium]|nr:hypothetical protein [Phycisphaerae bacterium]HRW54342.1 hypothetical protein [Phycisphaerae bacterium]
MLRWIIAGVGLFILGAAVEMLLRRLRVGKSVSLGIATLIVAVCAAALYHFGGVTQ